MTYANKILDRIIFCLTNNEQYLGFWNYISKLYSVKYNTIPTLFFSGSKEELDQLLNDGILSKEYGEIYHLPRVDGIFYDANLDWTCTWGLFYGASKFENEMCMLSGIDQIPLNNLMMNFLDATNTRENYIVSWSDAYGDSFAQGKVYPSSHHIGKGKYFKQIYNIENDWKDELIKVYNYRDNLIFNNQYNKNNLWGMDELYSSQIINNTITTNPNHNILLCKGLFEYFKKTRIDRITYPTNMKPKDTDEFFHKIKSGQYTEYHALRPFNLNTNLDILFEIVPGHNNIRSVG